MLPAVFLSMHPNTDTQCKRCGTCCRKGGPALHLQDRNLVTAGHISIERLFTIRIGEPVRDDVRGLLLPAGEEMIKIKGAAGSWACAFLHDPANQCTIYDHRPLECRLLCCRDTAPIERAYDIDRLTRKALLGHIKGLWALVVQHQRRCDYRRMAEQLDKSSPTAGFFRDGPVAEAARYDRALRELIVEKGLVSAETLDFVLGRPVSQVVRDIKRFEMLRNI